MLENPYAMNFWESFHNSLNAIPVNKIEFIICDGLPIMTELESYFLLVMVGFRGPVAFFPPARALTSSNGKWLEINYLEAALFINTSIARVSVMQLIFSSKYS